MRRISTLLVVLLLACSPRTGDTDAGVGAADAGGVVPDAGAGAADAGGELPDAAGAVPDAGPPDAAWDAGTVEDAGMDAGTPDAGPVDAGPGTWESCCASRGGCTTDADMAACSTLPAAYGDCAVGGTAGICVATGQCGGAWVNTAGYCPGPADIQCCTPPSSSGQACTGTEWPLPNTGLAAPALDARCPDGMTVVAGTTCVDRWEAALVELLPDGGTGEWSPYFNPGTRRMRAFSAPDAVPQGYINGNQAEAACQEAGKRLCTSTEWWRACRGASSFIYPYGNTRLPGVCNDARSLHPAIEYFGADDPDPFSKIQHPCLNQLANGLARTGAHPSCITQDGLLDMMGNLHEWVADADGTFRGGFYVDTVINGNGCLYATTAHTRPHWDYSTGFRCCADPR